MHDTPVVRAASAAKHGKSALAMSIVNLASYRFTALDELEARRVQLLSMCKNGGLRGSILLAPEGINLFVAGSQEACDAFCTYLDSDPATAHMEFKRSYSGTQPFNRMQVRLKREIITFGHQDVLAGAAPSSAVTPTELKRWLDEGKALTLVDTRNHFEIAVGTFNGALDLHIDRFTQFADAAKALPESLKKQPIVAFCTGGIRCEKAAPYLASLGFEQVYQLEGGILRYLEQCGNAHYTGECFVFDGRGSVNANLDVGDPSLRHLGPKSGRTSEVR